MFFLLPTQKEFSTERKAWMAANNGGEGDIYTRKNLAVVPKIWSIIISQERKGHFWSWPFYWPQIRRECWREPAGWKLRLARLTSRHTHVGPYLEARVDEDDGAPHHFAGKVSRDELHGGSQVVSGLVVLLSSVIWKLNSKGVQFNLIQFKKTLQTGERVGRE